MPPPPHTAWDRDKVQVVYRFSREIMNTMGEQIDMIPWDEQFPSHLLKAYDGVVPDRKDTDNTITYYQLKRKSKRYST